MLEGLRAVQNTWVGKAVMTMVMLVLAAIFAVWGIGDIFRGFHANEIARVGNVTISAAAFRQAYQSELQSLQQRTRRAITNAEAHRFGLDIQVLSRLMSEAILDDRAADLGLAISDAEIVKAIRTDPSFAGPGGTFDRARFESVLRNYGYSEQSFLREQRHTYIRQQLIQGLIGGLAAPKAAIEAVHRYQSEVRSVDYITVPSSAVGDIPAPDDAALQSFFDSRAAGFAAPQYRKLVVLSLSPSKLAKPEDISDADARARYEAIKTQAYGTPERRTLQQIVFPSEADATAADAKIKAGASFADIMADRKLEAKDVDLGTVTHDQIFDKAVADPAFALPADGTSGPVKGAFGWVLVHVTGIEPASVKPFEAVAADIKQAIATERAGKTLDELHDKIEDARTSGKSLTEAAQAAGQTALTIDAVDATGQDKAGNPVPDLPDRDALLKAAFASDIGVDNETLRGRDGSQTWFEVAAIEPAHPRKLEEVKPAVEAAWRKEETTKRLTEKTEEAVKALDGGKSLAEVAASFANAPVEHADGVTRNGGAGLPPDVVARIFDRPVGSAGAAAKSEDARILFKVASSKVPPLDLDSQAAKSVAERYRTDLSGDIVDTYLALMRSKRGAEVNQTALMAAVGPTE